MKLNNFFLLISIIILLSSCNHKFVRKKLRISAKTLQKPLSSSPTDERPQITIWIHGTKFFSRPFFKKLLYVPQGLGKATNIDPTYHHRIMAETLASHDPQRFPLEHFYFFGWSGYLSFEAREKAAADLYKELKELIEYYLKMYNQYPVIRIITHSHGGNVALNLTLYNKDLAIIVEELILLACPVQTKTALYVYNPMFRKIYSLFSTLDSIQILDPQGLYFLKSGQGQFPLFSERIFPYAPNLIQTKLKINGHGILHIGFLLISFLELLPHILTKLDKWYCQQSKDCVKQPILLSVEKRNYRLHC